MTTKKLYWENPYLTEFNANIVTIAAYEKDPTKQVVVLDQTAFYPEGGGQPWDEGYIHNSEVIYVYEENNVIYHVVDPMSENQGEVLCRLNWQRRFDFMQQHLGQHILSSVIEELYDADTVGFHLGNDAVTIDITREALTSQEVETIEKKANEYIYKNLSVTIHYPNKEELLKFTLRKSPSVAEGIRIVEIDKTDFSPCGGTHPGNTGEVGIIKIKRLEKMRGNTRIEFICGNRALNDYIWKNSYINDIASLLSIKDIETFPFVERIFHDLRQLEKENRNLQKNLLDYQIKELHNQGEDYKNYKIVVKIFDGIDFKNLQHMATALNRYENTIIFLATKNEKAQVVFSRSQELNLDINKLFREVVGMINGKGGGNPMTAQGGGDDLANLEGMMEAAKIKLVKEYLK